MSKIKVRLKRGNVVSAKLKPKNGIKARNSTVYLFDPTLIDGEVQLAQDWAIKTDGLVEEDGVGVDYSSKAYAIGGTGTQTNNAKYYAEQAGISETNASNSATAASGSASAANSSSLLAKDWAVKTDGTVDGVDYSAKYYAQQIIPIASAISTVAGISSAVSTVASMSADVSSVASNATNINKVASDISRVNLVADDIDSVHTVAVDISTVIDVASNKTNIDAVANDLTNIDAVAGDLANIDSASTYADNAHTWAEGTDSQVSDLGGEKSAKGWAARAKEIADGIGSIYKPAGSIAFESLPALSSDIQGNVYNITNDFTTTSDFVEGAGKSYPAGTNVVCIDTGSGVYKWDVLAGIVDLSGYVPTSRTVNGKALSSDISLNASDVGALPDTTVVPTINTTNNYVPYRSGASTFANSSLLYNSNAMAFTGRLHVGSSSPGNYYNKGRFTVYDNTPSQQVSSIALLNYGGGGGCGVAIDMYNTSANGGIPSGKFGLVDNGNYSGYLQLQVKKSGAASNPLLPAMNIVPVPAANSLTTCVSFGKDEFNNVLFDLHKPEASCTITDTDKRWGGSGTTYSVTGSNKFNPRLLVAIGDIVSFDNFSTEATVTGVVSNSSTCQITVNQTLGTISNKNISVKKAYFKITDENNNTKIYVDPYGKFGIGTGTPSTELDVAGTINASTDVKINGKSVALPSQTGQNGKFLKTDGTDASWDTVDALPSQTGQSGKFLTTDGSTASWSNVDSLPSQTGNSGKYLTTDGTDASWAVPKTHNLFDFMWRDSELSDMSWLRADTYSWQDGTVYSDAYNHLVADIDGKTASTETIDGTTVTYYLADDGHKIVDVADVSAIETVYSSTGVAWYYILDTANTRFKLPRTKYGFTGLRDTVGKYVEAGLPNIRGDFNSDMEGTAWLGFSSNGCFYGSTQVSNGGKSNGATAMTGSRYRDANFDASRSSSIYGNSTTVQQPATQMYLYFYVGQFSQSATEQTAGLNSSLFNGKADRDLNNVSAGIDFVVESYQNGANWYRLYKSGWVEQGGLKTGTGAASYNTVTLLKQMADSNYTITAMCKFKFAWCCEATDTTKSTTQFSIYTVDNGGNGYSRDFYWEVKGMSAQS